MCLCSHGNGYTICGTDCFQLFYQCSIWSVGKTAAFVVPILERLLYRPPQVSTTRVLILVPTRELAIQVIRGLSNYCTWKLHCRDCCVSVHTSGMDKLQQNNTSCLKQLNCDVSLTVSGQDNIFALEEPTHRHGWTCAVGPISSRVAVVS